MDFEEWLKEYREGRKRSDADWYPNNVQIFEAGQQSKQAEIDALKQQSQRLAMRLDAIQGVLQKQIDLIVELKK